MKKRKLFIGLLLGSAIFSLAACTNSGTSSTTSESTTPTSETTSTTTSSTTSTTTQTTTTTTTPAKEKFTVKYYAVIGDADAVEITDAQQTVEEGATTTADEAKLAKDGYKIAGYYTNEALGAKFDFTTAITKNTKIYVAYEALGMYDNMAASPNKILAYDFNDAVTIEQSTEFGSSAPALKATSATSSVQENGAITVKTDSFLVDFGKTVTTGVLQAYYEVTFNKVKTKEAWLQINGDSSTTAAGEVIGIRTGESSTFAYRIDGSSTDIQSSQAIAINITYKVLITIDTADGKMTLTVNDKEVFKDVAITATAIKGLKFTAKSDGTSEKVIDNVAVTFETKQANPLVSAKANAITEIEGLTLNSDETIKAKEQAKLNEIIATISAATTVEDVATALQEAKDYVAATKYLLTVKAYTAANTPATDSTDYKAAYLTTETVDTSKISLSGYSFTKLYTDPELTTEYTAGTLTANTTIYALASAVTSYSLSYEDCDSTVALNGQVVNGFTFVDTETKMTIASNSIKVAGNGSTSKACIKLDVPAGTYTITVNAKSGSTGNNAFLAVSDGTTEQKLTFSNDGASDQTVEVTLSAAGTLYFYRVDGKTVNIYTITIAF